MAELAVHKHASPTTQAPVARSLRKYLHVAAVHKRPQASCLSHDSVVAPSFLGFRNLMVLILVVMNLRLVIENFMKYGVLICFSCHDYRGRDVILAIVLYASVLCHLFIAHVIEVVNANHAKRVLGNWKKSEDGSAAVDDTSKATKSHDPLWLYTAWAHGINATLCLLITSVLVFWRVHHPMIGTVLELHALIVWLKICSYALTNRDLRIAMLHPEQANNLPELYATCPYPRNITLANLSYFWWCPSLCYQPAYPRTEQIRWGFVAKRSAEVASLSLFIWFASAQYAAPLLKNSLDKMAQLDFVSIVERLMKLSTISSVVWLAGFFAIFQSALNALAEVTRFADREFYNDWWNSQSMGMFWRTWNRPMYHFMKRHVFVPLVGRGVGPKTASALVFVFSAVLHEVLVGVPTHNILGAAFTGMVFQIPLVLLTEPLEKAKSINGKILGNCVFWVSFCHVGQPLAALLYYFAWTAKYGSVSKSM